MCTVKARKKTGSTRGKWCELLLLSFVGEESFCYQNTSCFGAVDCGEERQDAGIERTGATSPTASSAKINGRGEE